MKTKSVAFRALIGVVCFVILFGALFVFTYLHQVQEQQKFRVAVSKFGAIPLPHSGDSWPVLVEQLSSEELKNPEILTDQGTQYSSGHPFYSPFLNNYTIDCRSQNEFSRSHQPINITVFALSV